MGGSRGRSLPRLMLLLPLLPLPWSRCAPTCPPGSYYKDTWQPKKPCAQCTTCDGIQEYERPCSARQNAVCRCTPEYRCGTDKCQRCVCGAGEMNTEKGCQRCPDGQFNEQAGGRCQPWSRCPGHKILKNGTNMANVVCSAEPASPRSTAPPAATRPTETPEKDSAATAQLLALLAAPTVACLLCVLLCVFLRPWLQKKLLAVFDKLPLGQLAQEVDDCSCRYPEEEEGGSSEASIVKGEFLGQNP